MIGSKDVLLLLGLLQCAASVLGQSNNGMPSTASIVGFAVVLSFLIIALCVVVLLCVCFGKCRLPCKPIPPVRQTQARNLQSPRRTSNRRHLIPQPSPKNIRPSSLNNTTSVQPPPERQQRHSSLPPSTSISSPLAALESPQAPRHKISIPPQNGAQELAEAVSSLPVSTSTSMVVHLSQINAESFKKFTKSGNGATSPQKSASMSRTALASRPTHQRRGSDLRAPPGQAFPRMGRSEIPESGLPYQPQKSPYTPREYSTSRPAYSFPPRPNAGQPSNVPIPYLSNAHGECSTPDTFTGDDISSATNEPRHFPSNNQPSSTDSATKSPPPGYSTTI